MKNICISIIIACLGLMAASCGGADNVRACNDWVAKTSCGVTDISTMIDCNVYSETTCDIADYFDCLTTNTTCEMDVIDVTGWAGCAAKAVCD
jgi:hypothetical protein